VRLRPSRPGPAVPRGLGAGPGPGGRHCRLPGTQAAGPALLGRVSDSGPLGRSRIDHPFQLEGVARRGRACCFWGISRCLDMQGRATRAAARQPPGPVTPVRLRAQALRASASAASARAGRIPGPRAQGPGPRAAGLFSSWLPAHAAAVALLRKPPTVRLRLTAVRSKFEVPAQPGGPRAKPPRPQVGGCARGDPVGDKRPTTLGVGAAGPVSVAQKALLGRSSQETGAGTGPVALLAPWHFISYT
jgi:hypothetical protein